MIAISIVNGLISSPADAVLILNKLKNVMYCNGCFELAISANDFIRQVNSIQSEIIQSRNTILGYAKQIYTKYSREENTLNARIVDSTQSARRQILNRKFILTTLVFIIALFYSFLNSFLHWLLNICSNFLETFVLIFCPGIFPLD